MPKQHDKKTTVAFRLDNNLIDTFSSLADNQFGHGGITKILEKLVKDYVEKYDGVKDGKQLPSPLIMDEFESSLKHFIKTLDIEINRTPNKNKVILDGPLQYLINNLEDAITFAKALRIMRLAHNYDYQSQLDSKITLDEAYNMIVHEKMEDKFFKIGLSD